MKPVVIKRDGCRVPFNGMRIIEAVAKSAEAVGIKDLAYCASIAEQITQQLAGRDEVAIHDIQNMVENLLMAGERKEMARAYIEYRHDRDIPAMLAHQTCKKRQAHLNSLYRPCARNVAKPMICLYKRS